MEPSTPHFRVASIPWRMTNPYLDLFYGALERFNVQLVPGLQVSDRVLESDSHVIDAIHLHWPEGIWRWRGDATWSQLVGVAGLLRFLRKARRRRIAILWTIHNLEHHEGAYPLDWVGYRLLARYATLCICHSEWARREAIARHAACPERTIVMYHGSYDGAYPAPKSREETLRRIGLDPSRRTLICFGGLRRYKGLEEIVTVMRQLPPHRYQLILAGRPTESEWFGRVWSSAQTLDNVRLFSETVDDSTLADLIHASDCVLLPYRQITGSGALLTALTFGRGVIASDLPYFREILAPEADAAVFCEPGSAEALEQAVHRFFEIELVSRNSAARRLADIYAWDRVVTPLGDRLLALRDA